MAKVSKYEDNLLMKAVEQYFTVQRFGKVKVPDLVKWANKNFPGLEELKESEFRCPSVVKGVKGKEPVKVKRPYQVRLDEENERRKRGGGVADITLLHSSNVDDFLYLPVTKQRQEILDTRNVVARIIDAKNKLEVENLLLSAEKAELSKKVEYRETLLTEIQDRQNTIEKTLKAILRITDEECRREALKTIGISDNEFDLNKYVNSLRIQVDEMISMNDAVKQIELSPESLTDEVLKGIDL